MKIHYLGTAAAEGWPAVFCQCDACKAAREMGGKNIRTRSSVLIDDELLLDLPPDTYLHALREGLELGRVQQLLITHSHQDHFYPQELAMRKEPYAHLRSEQELEVWGNQDVVAQLSELDLRTVSLKAVKPGDTFKAGRFTVTALPAAHMLDRTETALLYILDDGRTKIFYAHDSGWYPEETWQFLEGANLQLVNFDCTNGPLPYRRGHMGIPAILEAKARLEEIGALASDAKCVITHFSHNGGLLHHQLEEHVAGTGLLVAYDGMILEL